MAPNESEGRCFALPAARSEPRRGFMLAELLVVLASLTIVTALLVPALATGRGKARSIRCCNNLGQVGPAFAAYAGDHNGRIMQRYYGFNCQGVEIGYDELLNPYVAGGAAPTNFAKWFTCPAQKQIDYPHVPGYGMNWYYDNVNRLATPRGNLTILLAETRGPQNTGSHRADRNSNFPGELDSQRHGGRANYLFFDGHVQTAAWDETIRPADWWGADQSAFQTNRPPPF